MDFGQGSTRTTWRCSRMVSEFEEHFEGREVGPMHGSSNSVDKFRPHYGHFGPCGWHGGDRHRRHREGVDSVLARPVQDCSWRRWSTNLLETVHRGHGEGDPYQGEQQVLGRFGEPTWRSSKEENARWADCGWDASDFREGHQGVQKLCWDVVVHLRRSARCAVPCEGASRETTVSYKGSNENVGECGWLPCWHYGLSREDDQQEPSPEFPLQSQRCDNSSILRGGPYMLVFGGGNRFRLERQQVVKELNKLWLRVLGGNLDLFLLEDPAQHHLEQHPERVCCCGFRCMWRASTSSSSTAFGWWERAAEALRGQHQLHGHCSKGGCLQSETLEWKAVVDPTKAGTRFPVATPGHHNQCGRCRYQSTPRTAHEIPAVPDGIYRWLGGAWYPGVQRGENQEGKPRTAEEHQKSGALTSAGGRPISKQHFDEQVGEAVDEADARGTAGGKWRSLGPIQQSNMLCGGRIDFKLVDGFLPGAGDCDADDNSGHFAQDHACHAQEDRDHQERHGLVEDES